MSYYYNYSIGYQTEDGKIYPWGVYDRNGKHHDAFYRSRSFASKLHERFYPIHEDDISDELREEFSYEEYTGEKCMQEVKYLPINELPRMNYIKSGYFLLDDIHKYEEDNDCWDLFYDKLTPQEYIIKMENEMKFGKPTPRKDEWGDEYVPKSASDYAFYMYPDTTCEEYEAFVISNIADCYEFTLPKDAKMVILETEG